MWINSSQGNDVDLKVWDKDTLVIVGEILNWSIVSELARKRLRKMISNLKEYSCRRLMIYTHLDENSLLAFKESGIDTLGIGYQILPKYYYNFYASKGQVIGRKIDSKETRLDLKNKLIAYLRRNGFCI